MQLVIFSIFLYYLYMFVWWCNFWYKYFYTYIRIVFLWSLIEMLIDFYLVLNLLDQLRILNISLIRGQYMYDMTVFFFDVQVLLSFMSQQLCCNICWKNEKAIGLLRPWERCFLLRAALQSQCYQEKNYKCAYVISLQMKEQKLVLCTCSLAICDKRRNRSKT